MLEDYENNANHSRLKSDVFSTNSADVEMMIDVPEIDNIGGDYDMYNHNDSNDDEGNMLKNDVLDTLHSSRRSS
jgi:hypothetical protein